MSDGKLHISLFFHLGRKSYQYVSLFGTYFRSQFFKTDCMCFPDYHPVGIVYKKKKSKIVFDSGFLWHKSWQGNLGWEEKTEFNSAYHLSTKKVTDLHAIISGSRICNWVIFPVDANQNWIHVFGRLSHTASESMESGSGTCLISQYPIWKKEINAHVSLDGCSGPWVFCVGECQVILLLEHDSACCWSLSKSKAHVLAFTVLLYVDPSDTNKINKIVKCLRYLFNSNETHQGLLVSTCW